MDYNWDMNTDSVLGDNPERKSKNSMLKVKKKVRRELTCDIACGVCGGLFMYAAINWLLRVVTGGIL